MSRMKPEVMEEFLKQPYVGVIATLRRDGRPYTVPVLWLWKDGGFWISGTYPRVWCKQLLRDPRCSLCIETMEPFPAHVDVDGRAEPRELPDFDIWPIHHELIEKYFVRGNFANAPKVDELMATWRSEPRVLFRLQPEVWRAIDLRVYKGKRADREYQATRSGA
jgi:PPOX class probable F420-dependent enzyme